MCTLHFGIQVHTFQWIFSVPSLTPSHSQFETLLSFFSFCVMIRLVVASSLDIANWAMLLARFWCLHISVFLCISLVSLCRPLLSRADLRLIMCRVLFSTLSLLASHVRITIGNDASWEGRPWRRITLRNNKYAVISSDSSFVWQ